MGLFDFIGNIFNPVAKIVDEIHVSDEERMTLRNELARIQKDAMTKFGELEQARLNALAKVQVAEANSKHWLQGNWRPITSITLVTLIVLGSFGIVTLNQEIYKLAEIFLGAYTASRGIEKVSAALKLGK